MKIFSTLLLCLFISTISLAQHISAQEVLDKSIAFHDPQGNWLTFNGALKVTMTTPKGNPRVSDIKINLPEEYFRVVAKRDSTITTYTLDKEVCTTSIKEMPEEGKRTPCETAALYKNYYTYLYGLPMKLKDNGTNISEIVKKKTLNNKEYLVLEVKYDEAVGSDIWYFFFDQKTYAMEAYQFYKGSNGSIKKDSGEYILLSELAVINDIKFPKRREWYYNNGGEFLGTDVLE